MTTVQTLPVVDTQPAQREFPTQSWLFKSSRIGYFTPRLERHLDAQSDWFRLLDAGTLTWSGAGEHQTMSGAGEHRTITAVPNPMLLLTVQGPEGWTASATIPKVLRPREYSELEALLNEFSQLPENWNSYGASPIPVDVIEKAKEILRVATRLGLPKPGIAPGGDGSVGFEWDTNSTELYISVHPDTDPTYLIVPVEGDETEGTLATSGQRAKVLSEFASLQPDYPVPNQDPVTSDEILLRRFPYYQYKGEKVYGSAFTNDRVSGVRTDRHSVSREKYTTAEQLRNLADKPHLFGVVAVEAQDYEKMGQQVRHSPTADDQGHCDVIGSKTDKVKRYLRNKADVRLYPSHQAT